MREYLTVPRERLRALLVLVAIHSAGVGMGLILALPPVMTFMGFGPIGEPFFPAQGGVFHLVMTVAYLLPAIAPERYEPVLVLIVVTKFMATLFLFTYWLVFDRVWIVAFSGLTDLIMGLLVLWAWRTWKRPATEKAG